MDLRKMRGEQLVSKKTAGSKFKVERRSQGSVVFVRVQNHDCTLTSESELDGDAVSSEAPLRKNLVFRTAEYSAASRDGLREEAESSWSNLKATLSSHKKAGRVITLTRSNRKCRSSFAESILLSHCCYKDTLVNGSSVFRHQAMNTERTAAAEPYQHELNNNSDGHILQGDVEMQCHDDDSFVEDKLQHVNRTIEPKLLQRLYKEDLADWIFQRSEQLLQLPLDESGELDETEHVPSFSCQASNEWMDQTDKHSNWQVAPDCEECDVQLNSQQFPVAEDSPFPQLEMIAASLSATSEMLQLRQNSPTNQLDFDRIDNFLPHLAMPIFAEGSLPSHSPTMLPYRRDENFSFHDVEHF